MAAEDTVRAEYDDAVRKAWDNLARYKFSNFGYWSSRVVFLGQLLEKLGYGRPDNPFRSLVWAAREHQQIVRALNALGEEE